MKNSFFDQAAQLLKDRSKRSRWLSVVLCLALLASAGTFYAFMRPGRAMVHTEKVLQCPLEVHPHTEDCEAGLACGMAEYVFHEHGEFCYDAEGKLVCTLPEIPVHEHDDSCWEVDRVLVCGQKEQEAHTHTADCYPQEEQEEEQQEDACTLEEHVHTDACFPTELTCTEEEHTHGESCYSRELACSSDEHEHSDSCYEITYDEEGNETGRELTCTQEEHIHGDSCYSETLICDLAEHTHDEGCYSVDNTAEPTCGLEEHTHDEACAGSEASGEAAEPEPICGLEEGEGHQHTEECWEERLVLVCGKTGLHMHTTDCYDENGELICGMLQVVKHQHTAACLVDVPVEEGVTGTYICGLEEHTHDATCSVGGVLICDKEEHVHMEECLAKPESKPAVVAWACGKTEHIHGAACRDENGELICGLEEHTHSEACLPDWICGLEEHTHTEDCYGEDGELICELEEHTHTDACLPVEWLCGKDEHAHTEECYDENGELICGLEEHEHTDACLLPPEEFETVTLDEEYQYTTEDGMFNIKFHVEGDARLPLADEEDAPEEPAPETSAEPSQEPAPSESPESSQEPEPSERPEPSQTPAPETSAEPSQEPEPSEESGKIVVTDEARNAADPADSELPAEPETIEVVVTPMGEDEEDYDLFLFRQNAEEKEESLLSVLGITVTCGGKELDLTDCTIEAEITPTAELLELLKNAAVPAVASEDGEEAAEPQPTGLRLTVYEPDEEGGVAELDSVYIEGGDAPATEPMALSLEDETSDDLSVQPMALSLEGEDTETSGVQQEVNPEDYTMAFTLRSTTIAMTSARETAAEITIQYYAQMTRAWVGKDNPGSGSAMSIIDTVNGTLPTNREIDNDHLTNIYRLEDGTIVSRSSLEQLFRERTANLNEILHNNETTYMDMLPQADEKDEHYVVSEIWVLKENGDPESQSGWEVYSNPSGLHFTNVESDAVEKTNYVYIKNGSVIRIIYNTTDATKTYSYWNGANFYDYDISNGILGHYTNGYGYSTDWQGINSCFQDTGSTTSKFVMGPDMVSDTIRGEWPNQWTGDSVNDAYFNIVKSTLPTSGIVSFVDTIKAPKLFDTLGENEKVTGRTDYVGGLTFKRVGDTYTLTSAKVEDTEGNPSELTNLEKLSFKYKDDNRCYSNQFWPMDNTHSHGGSGNDPKFGNGNGVSFIGSDGVHGSSAVGAASGFTDNEERNTYFGMRFSVDFELSADYFGPLDYLFFGDDDLWVYLEGTGTIKSKDNEEVETGTSVNKLICDLGGRHGGIGGHVNLRDYLPNGSSGNYTLYVFYLERGAYASTCWMQFTLPQVTSGPTQPINNKTFKTLSFTKKVEGDVSINPSQEFNFTLDLKESADKPLDLEYTYKIFRIDDNSTVEKGVIGKNGLKADGANDYSNCFWLRAGERIEIYNVPAGYHYSITEDLSGAVYQLEYNGEMTGGTVSGTIPEDGGGTHSVVLVNRTFPVLPETAGPGTTVYWLFGSGAAVIALAGLVLTRKRRTKV